MKQDTILILKVLITFLKKLVMGQGSFSAKCTGLKNQLTYCDETKNGSKLTDSQSLKAVGLRR